MASELGVAFLTPRTDGPADSSAVLPVVQRTFVQSCFWFPQRSWAHPSIVASVFVAIFVIKTVGRTFALTDLVLRVRVNLYPCFDSER